MTEYEEMDPSSPNHWHGYTESILKFLLLHFTSKEVSDKLKDYIRVVLYGSFKVFLFVNLP